MRTRRLPGFTQGALLLVLAALSAPLLAAETPSPGRVALPQPQKPLDAEACVEPVDVMRRRHMIFLDHQRDATVLDGERGGKYSLSGCIDCHNPPRADGKLVRYSDPEHFCAECHRFASVSIDCFECHADRGLVRVGQSRLDAGYGAADLNAATLGMRIEATHVD